MPEPIVVRQINSVTVPRSYRPAHTHGERAKVKHISLAIEELVLIQPELRGKAGNATDAGPLVDCRGLFQTVWTCCVIHLAMA